MKKITAFLGLVFGFFTAVSSVLAVTQFTPPPGFVNPDTQFEDVPQLVIKMVFGLAIFLAVVYLMYGGIRWITSRGDKMAIESARKHIVSAIIGIVVVAGTFLILQVLFTVLGVDNPLKCGFQLPILGGNPNCK